MRGPDGGLEFRRPNGWLLREVPPAPPILGDPIEALRATHEAQGLRITPRTSCPLWLGERLDVGWAIDVLHPLAAKPRDRSATENGSRVASGIVEQAEHAGADVPSDAL